MLRGAVPVCVELGEGYESLPGFTHPEHALYVFGPEDGSVPRPIKQACHQFVSIPTHVCLNLAAAVNVVLYDRLAKTQGAPRLEQTLWRERT
jgi:tRNA(Leu) C34 or U34 (ribose-2'-O)-methylase TrmL